MICGKCGNELQKGNSFCTMCGQKAVQDTKQSEVSEKTQVNKFMEKVNGYIETLGDRRVNKCISVAAIISMISIRLFGFVVITILVTFVNSLLIIHNFKQNNKLDVKMFVLSLAVFFVGLLIVI